MTPRKPIRTRKARWPSVCPACRRAVLVGQLITSENRRPWIHAACLIDARTQRTTYGITGKAPARKDTTS